MKKFFFINTLFFTFLYSSEFTLPKFEKSPEIDGIIEDVWKDSVIFKDFKEFMPKEGEIPPFETKVFIGYDEKNLYVAFKCYDDVKTIRKTLTKRDQVPPEDDIVFFILYTYGKDEGYMFGTNAISVQFDGINIGRQGDFSFDTYFEVRSFISDSFFSSEFKIPFSSLRFESKEKNEWRIIFIRRRPREYTAKYSFPSISQNNPSLFDQAIKIIIPEKIEYKEKKNEIIPYLIGSQEGERKEKYENDRGKGNLGFSGKTKLRENLILDYALNPDFAQIETDIPQIDVNTQTALYYPEKRPVFMEGSGILKTGSNSFYTRMINNPFYILKLTGRISNSDLYFLSSYDENSLYIIPFEDTSFSLTTSKKSFINILRLKRTFINQESYLGFFGGDRRLENSYGSIFGIDTRIKFLKNYIFFYEGVYSHTKEPEDTNIFNGIGIKFKNFTDKFDGERFSGYTNRLNFSAIFKYLYLSLYYREVSPTFRSDIGYITQNNSKGRGIGVEPIFYFNRFSITTINLHFAYYKEENFEKISKEEWFNSACNINFSFFQSYLKMTYTKYPNNIIFNIYTLNYSRFKNMETKSFGFQLQPFRFLLLFFGNTEGDIIFYKLNKIFYRRWLSIYTFLNFTKLQISFNIQKQIFYDEKNKFLEAEVFSFRTSYSFTQRTSLRVLLTYYKNSIGIYPLFTYQINPFSFLYFGLNQESYEYGEFLSPKKLEGQRHQFFVKIQHSFNF
jgi:hypothetical protein